MNDQELIQWMNQQSSPLVKAFIYRLLAKRSFRKGEWYQAIELSRIGLGLYPARNGQSMAAEREYIRYCLATVVGEPRSKGGAVTKSKQKKILIHISEKKEN